MNIFLEAKSIYLRPLHKEDLTLDYVQWLNDIEVCAHNSHAVLPYTQEKMESYYEHLRQTGDINIALAIIDKGTDKHIGNIALQNIDWISRNAEYAIILGNKQYWNKGVASEASQLICKYGFHRLNLHRIYCGTTSGNIGMQKLAKKIGMRQEGIRREAIFKNGQFWDITEYGLLKDELLEIKETF